MDKRSTSGRDAQAQRMAMKRQSARMLTEAMVGAGLVILACVGLIAGWLAESLKMGSYFVGGIAVSLLLLAGVAWLLLRGLRWLVQKAPVRWSVEMRQGMANLYRPGNHAPSVLVALGIGVTFTLSVYLLQKSLLQEVASAAPPGTPNVILINITDKERDGVQKLFDGLQGLKSRPAMRRLRRAGSSSPSSS